MLKYILYIILCMLMINSVSAIDINDFNSSLISVYKMDDFNDYLGRNNLTDDSSGPTQRSDDGVNGSYYFFDGADDVLRTSNLAAQDTATYFAISYWIRYNDSGGFDPHIDTRDASVNNGYSTQNTNTDQFEYGHRRASGQVDWDYINPDPYDSTGKWVHVFFAYDNGRKILYIDGVLIHNASASNHPNTADSGDLRLMNDYSGTYHTRGEIDEVYIWNSSLNHSVRQELANGTNKFYPFLVGGSPPVANESANVTINSPVSGYTQNNQSLVVNVTYEQYNLSNASCYVELNNTVGDSLQVNSHTTFDLNYTIPDLDGSYSYFVQCDDGTTLWNSTNRTIVLDRVFPLLSSLNPNNAFNENGSSQINNYQDIMSLNLTFTDNIDLYAYEINITRGGTVFYNETNESISGTSFDYYRDINTSSWSAGTYDVLVTLADSHTSDNISDYQVTKKKSSITFKTPNDNNIKIETDSPSSIDATKLLDRYTFDISFDDGLVSDRLFHVKTDKCKLVYRPNSGYKAHFLTYCDGSGNWVDFEGTDAAYQVNKLDDYHYTVQFFDLDPEISFRSVGGLNIINYSYSWYKGNYSIYADPDPVGRNESFTINLSMTYDSNTQSDIDAELLYNGGVYNASKTSGASSYYFEVPLNANTSVSTQSFDWNVTITQINGSVLNFNLSSSHTIYNWSIDNCSSGNITIQLNVFDEDDPTIDRNATFEIDMQYWITDPVNNVQNLNYKEENANYSNICIDPNNVTLYSNLYVSYLVDGGFTHRYILYNQTLTNTTLNISMYNYNKTAGISDLSITARDRSSYDYFDLVVAKLQRRYVSEGIWRTVQMDQSGDFGELFFNVKEQSVDYRLLYYDTSNNLLKQTETLKFVCSSGVCELTQLLDPFSATTTTADLDIVSAYNNDTRILNINWSDPLANNNIVKIKVTKETATGTLLLCEFNQTGASGSANCNTTGYTGDVLLTILTSNSPYTPVESSWITLTRASLGGMLSYAESAFWTIGIMITAIGFGLWSPIAALVSGLIGLITILFLGLFTPLTVSFIIIAIVMGTAIGIKIKQ